MIKIGKPVPVIIGFLLLLFGFTHEAVSQDLSVEATVSETKIFIGEQFSLSVSVESSSQHSLDLPQIPNFNGARVISGTPSRSTRTSIINGRTTRSTTYTYTLLAERKGNFTIPSIAVRVDGETRQTNSIPIEIIEKGNLSSEGESQLPDIFVRVEVDEERPVVGQQIVASIVLYFKQNIEVTSFQPSFGWRTDGFWKEELENISQPRAESTILNGVRYRKATLLRYALFPSRSGELSLSEYGLTAGIRSQVNRNDPFGSFFGSGTNQRRVTLNSEQIDLTIRQLPPRDNALWMNAVGDFTIERTLNTSEIRSGDSIELITTIKGAGNIPLINRPNYSLPDAFDQFNPRESSDVGRRGLTIQGSKTFTELLVSRAPGTYEIPEERIAVYNPSSRRYNYKTLPAISFEVLPAPAQLAGSGGAQSFSLQPVTGLATWYSGEPKPFYNTLWFWIFLTLPIIAMAIAYWKKHQTDKLLSDRDYQRSHYSYQTAKERLHEARNHFTENNTKQVYHKLHKAITGFISDKLALPEAGLSDRELIQAVEGRSINGEITAPLKHLLDKCNTISYAPVGSKDDISDDIEKTEKLINDLKKKL